MSAGEPLRWDNVLIRVPAKYDHEIVRNHSSADDFEIDSLYPGWADSEGGLPAEQAGRIHWKALDDVAGFAAVRRAVLPPDQRRGGRA